MQLRRTAARAAILVLAALPLLAATASASPGNAQAQAARERHEAILAYWTPEQMSSAVPRDFVLDPVSGFRPAAKPPGAGKPGGGGGGGDGGVSTSTIGASWPNGLGEIYATEGKVFFTMSGGNWVCSGTVVADGISNRSIVLTAGHCAYDETVSNSDNGFASNWMFVPRYDATPTINCFSTPNACWTAEELVVHQGWATAGGFNDVAVRYDWAFAVVAGNADGSLGSGYDGFPVSAAGFGSGTQTFAYGYPAAGKYKGKNLTYCAGSLGFDPYNSNDTYRLACNMTGGSSGGGWLVGGNTTGDVGSLFSVNSYGYSGVTAMHGPIFNPDTADTLAAAKTVAFDSGRGLIVP